MSVPFTFRPDTYAVDAVHVSLDLETASAADNAAIVHIAAVVVGAGYTNNVFDEKISLASCERHGCDVSVETMSWWGEQDEKLRRKVFCGASELGDVLERFYEWLKDISNDDLNRIHLWGNGADFDCTILRNAYEIFDKWPLDFRKHEHLRTLKRSMPVDWQELAHKVFMKRFGEVAAPHDAAYDAIYQAHIIQYGLEYRRQCDAIMDDLK